MFWFLNSLLNQITVYIQSTGKIMLTNTVLYVDGLT